jgi:hypothetical protein
MTQHSTAARPAAAPAFEALAQRLLDGPLRTVAALQGRAAELAKAAQSGDGDHLADLTELVHLAQTAMLQFHEFTRELTALVAELAARRGPENH